MIVTVIVISTAESYMNLPITVVLTTNTIMALIFSYAVKFIEEEISSHIDDIFNRKVKIEFRYDESLAEDNYEEKKL